MSYECPPIDSVTLSVTDSEGGWVGKHFVLCRWYAIPDTIAIRGGEAVHAHCCECAALHLHYPAVVFARGDRTAASRSLTPLLHAALNSHSTVLFHGSSDALLTERPLSGPNTVLWGEFLF
jgi:hypothetical protein